jgi:hypothetical protein
VADLKREIGGVFLRLKQQNASPAHFGSLASAILSMKTNKPYSAILYIKSKKQAAAQKWRGANISWPMKRASIMPPVAPESSKLKQLA